MQNFGAHQSISGGYDKALERIAKIGGTCLQIFSSSPRGWTFAKIDQKAIDSFVFLKKGLKIDPVYFHATYLINLANNERIGQLSKQSLIYELNLAKKLKVVGTIVHLGSYKGTEDKEKYQTMINNIKEILSRTPKETFFIIENAGNKKIGKDLEEIARIINDVNNKRVRLCLDTCHLFSSGYQFTNDKELVIFLKRLKDLDLLDRLELFHTNDSRDPFDSGRDRHENIGQGTIPLQEFSLLINNTQTKKLPFIIETPGFDNNGPDKKNLDILKSLVRK